MKVGYRELETECENLLVGYIESKNKTSLRGMTQRASEDEYIFVMDIPNKFDGCQRPDVAAERALKSMLLNFNQKQAAIDSNVTIICLSSNKQEQELPGHRSDEFYIAFASANAHHLKNSIFGESLPSADVYQGLMQALRKFAGDPGLLPCRVGVVRGIEPGGRQDKKGFVWPWDHANPPWWLANYLSIVMFRAQ